MKTETVETESVDWKTVENKKHNTVKHDIDEIPSDETIRNMRIINYLEKISLRFLNGGF